MDTLRADTLGAYGNARARTPALDRLAREGVLFERAYAPTSWTRASMASLLTGTEPTYHGAEDRTQHLPQELETLAELLQAHGYATAFVNTNPNAASFFGFSQGFDEVIELFDRRAPGRVEEDELIAGSAEAGERALAWLATAQRPFFLLVLTVDPHFPHDPPEELVDGDEPILDMEALVARQPEVTPALAEQVQGHFRRMYRAEVAENDRSFGSLVEALRERGELDRTVVVFTSDHGEEFWEHGLFGHGYTLHEEVLRVPLVLRHPALGEPGRRVGRVVGTVDLVPTLASLLGVPAPTAARGRSLLEEPAAGDAAEAPVFASLALDRYRLLSVRDERFRLVLDRRSDEARLYDTRADPGETTPLDADAEPARQARERLEGALRAVAARRSGFDAAAPAEAGAVPEPVSEALEALGYAE